MTLRHRDALASRRSSIQYWWITASEQNPEHAWHWRQYFAHPDDAQQRLDRGGPEWIRSHTSFARIVEMHAGDVIVAYQAGEGVVGLAYLASDGYQHVRGGHFDSFDLARGPTVWLSYPVPYEVIRDLPGARTHIEFVRIRQGAVFRIHALGFEHLLRAILLLNPDRVDAIHALLAHANIGSAIEIAAGTAQNLPSQVGLWSTKVDLPLSLQRIYSPEVSSPLTSSKELRLSLTLSARDEAMLRGKHGPAARMALSIIARMADVSGAQELMDISAAHIDSALYMGDATLEFAERLASLGARVAVPTTLNVSGVDEHGWREWAVPAEWAEKARRQMLAYQRMGCVPTWTCAPYQTELRPRFGQQIAWGESNAIVFANSVIGARTERYPDLLDICAAITGRVPAVGLHLTENRAGQLLIRLRAMSLRLQANESFYPVLGHWLGKLAQDRIPVVDGLQVTPTEDQLKALGAAAASSGAVALFHLVGITPEAPTLDAAFQGRAPQQVIEVTLDELRTARRELTTADDEPLDMVVLGSPHFSLAEFKQLAPLLDGQRCHSSVQFLVTSSRAMTALADQAGALEPLRRFGGKVTVDTCILTTPMLPPSIKVLMTNSAKYAYYAPGLLNARVVFGSLADCVASAVAGRVIRDESLWNA